MAHGVERGVKRPVIHGVKHNLASLYTSGVVIPQDGPGSVYVPETNAQFSALTGVTPLSIWLCQEASGNLVDVNGVNTLTKNALGHLYQQAVAGWTRKAVTTVDGTANQKWVNTTTAPNASADSIAFLAYIRTPSAPAATRTLLVAGTTLEHRVASGLSKARYTVLGVNTDSASTFADGTVRPVLIVYDRTNSAAVMYTNQDVVTGTYGAGVLGINVALGAGGASAADAGFLYAAIWTGAAAEALRVTATARTFLQSLNWTIPW